MSSDVAEPERELLRAVLRNDWLAARLARSPGGWRTLSEVELAAIEVTAPDVRVVRALQELVRRGYPTVAGQKLVSSSDVARVYRHRLGGEVSEVMIAVGLDGQNNVLGEIEVAKGGAHGLCITPRDVLRPLIRMGASGFVLVHNHPSGDPAPSAEDIAMTIALVGCGEVVGVVLVDHIIVAGRSERYVSLLDVGIIQSSGVVDEARDPRPTV